MSTEHITFPSLAIDRVASLLDHEWLAYIRDVNIRPIPDLQNKRALTIAWFATVLPEAVPFELVNRMKETLTRYREELDYGDKWYSAFVEIEVALYAMTGDISWITPCLRLASAGSSLVRQCAIEALALVADRLEFREALLLRVSAGHNLEVVHMACEWSVALVMVTRGPAETKQEWLRSLIDPGKNSKPKELKVLSELSDGKPVTNSYFLSHFLKLQHYITTCLACVHPPRHVQGVLDFAPTQLFFDLKEEADLGSRLNSRLKEHPMMQYQICVTDWRPNGRLWLRVK